MKNRMRPWATKRLFRFPTRSRDDVQADIAEEFAFHLDMRTEALIRDGVPAAQARAQAMREFGDRESGARACVAAGERIERSRRIGRYVDEFRQDTMLGLRLLRRSPGFATVAIVTLALGIGANTAMYSVLDSLLLRPLPYPEPDRLVQIAETLDTGDPNGVSGGAFLDWRTNATAFEAMALTGRVALNLRQGSVTERVRGLEVSHEFFRVLGVPLRLGRGFLPDEDQPGGPNLVVVLTEELWRSRFNADPGIVGRTILLDEVPRTVVGVLPARSWLIRDDQLFVPAVLEPGTARASRSMHWAAVFGRLAPDATVAGADAELKTVKQRLAAEYPAYKQQWSVLVMPAVDVVRDVTRDPVAILVAAVAVLLFIACANVANLLIARASRRDAELALRTAVGATGSRLVRQVLTENVVLAALGGVAGLAVASIVLDALRAMMAMAMPMSTQPELDGRTLTFSVLATLVAALLAGGLPAVRARRVEVRSALNESGRGGTGVARHRTQAVLVAAEVALTVMLLTSAALLVRSLINAASEDPGFNPARVLAFDVSLPEATYDTREKRFAFSEALVERLRRVPGVDTAGSGMAVPFSSGGYGEFFRRPGADEYDRVTGRMDFVSPGYLEALGPRLLAGRLLTPADNRADGERVAVVSASTARRFFPDDSPIGQSLSIAGGTYRIVGVVADLAGRRLDEPHAAIAYVPRALNMSQVAIVVRTSLAPMALVEPIRREVARLDAGVAVANARALDQAMAESITDRRLLLWMITAFALLALALACIGLYGVMAYAVANRRRELGIRLALGAPRREIMLDVLRRALAMTAVGLAVGIGGALAAGRLLANALYRVGPVDPLAMAATVAIIMLVATTASVLPALRASRIDPTTVLRNG